MVAFYTEQSPILAKSPITCMHLLLPAHPVYVPGVASFLTKAGVCHATDNYLTLTLCY